MLIDRMNGLDFQNRPEYEQAEQMLDEIDGVIS